MIDSLSVFFPCINEEGSIEDAVSGAEEVLKKLNLKYEIIIVDDGSTDKTGQIANRLAEENHHIRVIHHPKNLGYGEALKSGFYNASFNTIVYTDGDGQFDFSEVTKFLEKIEDSDVVIGYRIKRQDSILRKLFGKGWKLTLLVFFGLRLKDVDCGFKMIKREVLQKIPHLESQRGAMINAELVIKSKKYGFKVGQVGVTHYPRLSGRPTGANFRVIMKSYADLLWLWWKLKDHKIEFLAFIAIILLALFLRFFRLSEYMTFLGDEGRDALMIKRILVDHDFPLLGPPASVGNIYLGPFYYYMMTIPMAIWWLNPISAAGMVATIGTATVGLIYYLTRKWFGFYPAVLASLLYAISPINIIHSRSSWNPNPAPFFALLAFLGFYKARQNNNFRWLMLSGGALAAALQMHYLTLILLPILILLWLKEWLSKRRGNKLQYFGEGSVGAVIVFLAIIWPLVLFDFRYNFMNYHALINIFSTQEGTVSVSLSENLIKIPDLYINNLVGRYMAGGNFLMSLVLGGLIILPFAAPKWITWMLNLWLWGGLIGLSFYKGPIYDHYLGFLNPAPYLLLGGAVGYLKKSWQVTAIIILLLGLGYLNLTKLPLLNSPNRQLQRTQEVAKFIISRSGNQNFNFALLAQRNYDAAYQFYLDIYGHKPKIVPLETTEQLFVVCEDSVCDPTHNAKYEIAAFGWSKIDWQQEFDGVKIYRLVHNPSGKP